MDATIFDKILSKEIPAKVVKETDHYLAFHDINPQAETHVLVIPKFRIPNFAKLADIDDPKVGQYIKGIAATAKELGLEDGGYRVVFNTGANACQTVYYIHGHILGGQQLAGSMG